MSGWLFARGREDEAELSAGVAAGASSLLVIGADALFAPGQTLFIEQAEGEQSEGPQTEWLGAAVSVAANSVTATRPLRAAKAVGAKIWRPAALFNTTGMEELPGRHEWQGGVAVERSLSGESYAVAYGEARHSMTLALAALTPHASAAAIDWLRSETEWGLIPFTIIDPRGTMWAVRLEPKPFALARLDGGRRRLELALEVIEEGGYR